MRRLVGIGAAEWDSMVLRFESAHLLQSSAWGDLKARWGWAVHRMAWGPPGGEWAVAQVLVRPVAGRVLDLAYVPRGPVLSEPHEPLAWEAVLADLATWARARRLLSLKMDPGLRRTHEAAVLAWARRGWRPVVKEIQFPNTMITDLTVGAEALLAGMKSKTRYNVGLAARRGVRVRPGGLEDLPTFFQLYAETGRRGGFAVRAWPYYRDAWTTLLNAGWGTLLLAELNGRPLAASMPVAYGDTAWFLYGASGEAGREHMPSYVVQWESLRWAIARGCRRYDWWGAPTRLEPGDSMWGVYQFKRGFGAELVEQFGAWEQPGWPAAFVVFNLAERARARWLRASSRPSPAGRGGDVAAL